MTAAPTTSHLVSRLGGIALGILPIALLAAGWELVASSGLVTPFMLPKLSAVLQRIYDDALTGELFINLGLTLYRALVGFAISVVGGVLLGAAMARSVLAAPARKVK